MKLERGDVAVVTGAASGIGFALAERFATAGLNVVAADVEPAALDDATARLAAHGVDVLGVPTDVSIEEQVQALASTTVERFGGVQVVCNNAGVMTRADPWLGPTQAWEWVIGVNLWGVIHGVRAFLPHLALGGRGHIVNTASMAGLVPGLNPIYDATKHAIVAISENLFYDLHAASLPVGVSVLCPGWVRTAFADAERNWPAGRGTRRDRSALATRQRRRHDARRGRRPRGHVHRGGALLGAHPPPLDEHGDEALGFDRRRREPNPTRADPRHAAKITARARDARRNGGTAGGLSKALGRVGSQRDRFDQHLRLERGFQRRRGHDVDLGVARHGGSGSFDASSVSGGTSCHWWGGPITRQPWLVFKSWWCQQRRQRLSCSVLPPSESAITWSVWRWKSASQSGWPHTGYRCSSQSSSHCGR